MKNIFTASLLIIIFSGFLPAQGIKVFKPSANESIQKGSDYTIRWNNLSKNQNLVKIRLFDQSGKVKILNITNSTPNNGQFLWKKALINNIKPGAYTIKVKTLNNSAFGDSGPFKIENKKEPDFGIIQVEAFKPPTQQNIPRHRAPAIKQPSNASFNIKNIHYGVNKNGRIEAVWIVVGYNSKTPFSFSKYPGHPKDGPAYMNCKIMVPYWPEDSNYKGPFKTKVIFNHRLSVRYNGQNSLKCEPEILNAGTGEFELIFSPAHSGKVEGLFTRQRMPKSNPWQGHTDYCMKTYLPKMALRLFVHTKEGVKQTYKEFYLGRGSKRKSITIPGEVNICSSGVVYW